MLDQAADVIGDRCCRNWIGVVRPSRRGLMLRPLLRMTTVFYAIKNPVILRRPRSGRLEGRTVIDAAIMGGGELLSRTSPRQFGEPLLRRRAGGDRLLGVFVLQFLEAETAARDDLHAARQRVLVAAEQ